MNREAKRAKVLELIGLGIKRVAPSTEALDSSGNRLGRKHKGKTVDRLLNRSADSSRKRSIRSSNLGYRKAFSVAR